MITKHHNHDAGYISLVSVHLGDLPKTIHVNGLTLLKKGELHVSLMALKHLVPLLGVSEDKLVRDFLEFQKDHALTNFELTHQFRFVQRGEKASVIVMVHVPEIEGLFAFFRAKYPHDIPTQPTHITLYTLQPEAGIGIFSKEELERDSKLVSLPEVVSVLNTT